MYEAQDPLRCGTVTLEPVRIIENSTDRQSLTATLVLGQGPDDSFVELAFPEGALTEEGARTLLDLVHREIALLAETPATP